jgi:hypothetical protein
VAWRRGEYNFLQSSLTRAVFFSAMMATAFGSLWSSAHPGISSMGKLLALRSRVRLCPRRCSSPRSWDRRASQAKERLRLEQNDSNLTPEYGQLTAILFGHDREYAIAGNQIAGSGTKSPSFCDRSARAAESGAPDA